MVSVVGGGGADGGHARDASRGADWFAQPLGYTMAVLLHFGYGQLTVLHADDYYNWVRQVVGRPVAAYHGAIEMLRYCAFCADAGGLAVEAGLTADLPLLHQPRSCRHLSLLSQLLECCWGRSVCRWLQCGMS